MAYKKYASASVLLDPYFFVLMVFCLAYVCRLMPSSIDYIVRSHTQLKTASFGQH